MILIDIPQGPSRTVLVDSDVPLRTRFYWRYHYMTGWDYGSVARGIYTDTTAGKCAPTGITFEGMDTRLW